MYVNKIMLSIDVVFVVALGYHLIAALGGEWSYVYIYFKNVGTNKCWELAGLIFQGHISKVK